MKASQVLQPKEPALLRLTLLLSAAIVAAFALAARVWPVSPKRGIGLLFGILSALLFVAGMLYPARRPRARPFGTARVWLQAHVYAGTLAFVAALAHAGFRWPAGWLGGWLLLLAFWTAASGLLGVWLQKWIPAALAEGLSVEALYERIPSLITGLREEADRLMEGASDVLTRFYAAEVRGLLAGVQPSWAFLLDVRGGRERAVEPFHRIAQFVEEAEKERVHDLMHVLTDKIELDAQYSLQAILRGWLVLHAPAAGLLMGLIAVHVFGWLWY